MQNAFGRNNRLTLTNTTLQKEIIKLQTLEAVEDYLASLKQSYFNWAGAFRRMTLEKTILANIQLLRNEVELKYKRRVATQNDVNRIRLQELTQSGVLLEIEKNYATESHHIAQLINDPSTYTPLIRPLANYTYTPPTQNRSLHALSLLDQVNQNHVKISANELFPSMTLDTALYKESRQINGSNSDTVFITSGLSIEVPYPNNAKKDAYQLASSNQRQSELEIATSTIHYHHDAFRLTENLRVLAKQYELDIKKSDLATDILTRDGEDYRRGSLTLNQYIDSLNQSIQAQHMELSRLIQYHKAHVEWLRITDQLISP